MTITIQLSESDRYELWASDGRMSAAPAGPRLLRGNPPCIQFTSDTLPEAEANAAALRKYLASLPKTKTKTLKHQA